MKAGLVSGARLGKGLTPRRKAEVANALQDRPLKIL
jgi:hypothetical protein